MPQDDDRTPPYPEGESVSCAQCKRLIPRSAALHPEVEDHVLYFCGMDCYADWKRVLSGRPPRAPGQGD